VENNNDLLIIKAKIRLRTASEGGRLLPIKSGYRPNHVFEASGNSMPLQAYVGDIRFDDNEYMQPGESKVVTIRFLRNAKLEQFMKIGQRWLIYEVPKIIAEAEIVEI
jgi:hypothetical protein